MFISLPHRLGFTRHREGHPWRQNVCSHFLGVFNGLGKLDALEIGADVHTALPIDSRDLRSGRAHLHGYEIAQGYGFPRCVSHVQSANGLGIRTILALHPHANIVTTPIFLECPDIHTTDHHLNRLGDGPGIHAHGRCLVTVRRHGKFRQAEFQALVDANKTRVLCEPGNKCT